MRKVLQSDVATTSTSYSDVTGLSFPVTSGRTYHFRFTIDYTVNATTIGTAWSINGPASPTRLSYSTQKTSSTSANTILNGSTSYGADTVNTDSAATGANLAIIEGIITPSADGTVVARFLVETTGTLTAKAGSIVNWFEVK